MSVYCIHNLKSGIYHGAVINFTSKVWEWPVLHLLSLTFRLLAPYFQPSLSASSKSAPRHLCLGLTVSLATTCCYAMTSSLVFSFPLSKIDTQSYVKLIFILIGYLVIWTFCIYVLSVSLKLLWRLSLR